MIADLRLAFRRLRHTPAFTVAAVATLATAIAANSAVFSAVYGVLLAPIPIPHADRIVVAWQVDNDTNAVAELTHRHLREWTATGRAFEAASLMASHNWSGILQGMGEPTRVWFNGVSANYFDVLGVTPVLGRAFRPQDDVPGAAPVAVLNYGAWQQRFGGDPAIVGKTMRLEDDTVEIIGVMPQGMDLPRDAEFWMPIVPILTGGDPANTMNLDRVGVSYIVGRLKPDVDRARAAAELDDMERQITAATPGRLPWGDRAVAVPLLDHVFGPTRPALWALWAAVSVLLLIACANVSGLMLTRVAQRSRENAVRVAIGASRVALMREWLAESALVAVAGGVTGLAAAGLLTRAIVGLAPPDLPRFEHVDINWTVAIFTAVIVIGAAVIVGLLPMRHSGTGDLVEALRPGSRTAGDRRSTATRSALLVMQMAMAVVLMVAAGLVLRSFVQVRNVNLGFSPEQVVSMTVEPRSAGWDQHEWIRRLVERVSSIAGVSHAAAVSLPPLALGPIGQGARVVLEGQPENASSADRNPVLNYLAATTDYPAAMGIRVVRGRWFADDDRKDSPRVAVVSESTARALWPGQDPIGRKVYMSSFTPGVRGSVWRTVVGVVNDVRYRGLGDVQLDVYDPVAQVGHYTPYLVVRASIDPSVVVPAIREGVRTLDASAIVDGVQTLETVVARAGAPWRFSMWLFGFLALVSIGLACVGLFGVTALDVHERRKEFAVRVALGASAPSILRGVLARAGSRVGLGVGLGLGTAALVTSALQSVLFEVSPHDPWTYLLVAAVVALVVTVAAIVPARRAAATPPGLLLR